MLSWSEQYICRFVKERVLNTEMVMEAYVKWGLRIKTMTLFVLTSISSYTPKEIAISPNTEH